MNHFESFVIICFYDVSALTLFIRNGQLQACLDYEGDPCKQSNHKELDDPSRSSAYENPDEETQSDYTLVPGWYVSVNPAGGDMPTSAPDVFYCQALSPIWLNGE